ncbi:hypothetical protein CsSME_00036116 [Camellia sinensis var. sinensis]
MQSYLDDIIDPKGWLEWNGRSPDRVYYAEYKNEGPGANTGGRVPWEKVGNLFLNRIVAQILVSLLEPSFGHLSGP